MIKRYIRMAHLALDLRCYTVAVSYLQCALAVANDTATFDTIYAILQDVRKESNHTLA